MEVINWAAVKVIFDVGQALFLCCVAIYVWHSNRHRATSTAIRDVHGRLDEVDRHVQRIEQTLDNRPGFGEIDKLRGDLSQTNRQLEALAAQLQGTTSLLNRLHEYLLTERGTK